MSNKQLNQNVHQDVLPMLGNINPNTRVESSSMIVNSHKIRLNSDITEPEMFNEELNIIESLSENDSCEICINSNGGHLDTAIEFCSAIEASQGHVHCAITGCAHSAASMIFLKGSSFSVSPYATMMIHNPSGGFIGKFNENFQQADHFRKWVEFFYKDVYKDFLTDQEIDSVLDGKDIWLNAEEIKERLEIMCQARNARATEEHDNAQQEPEDFFEEQINSISVDTPLTRGEKGIDKDLINKIKYKHSEDEPNTSPFDVLMNPPEDSFEESSEEVLNVLGKGRAEPVNGVAKRPFKVGDYVEVLSLQGGAEDYVGCRGVVEHIEYDHPDISIMLDSGWRYDPEDLELISPVNPLQTPVEDSE